MDIRESTRRNLLRNVNIPKSSRESFKEQSKTGEAMEKVVVFFLILLNVVFAQDFPPDSQLLVPQQNEPNDNQIIEKLTSGNVPGLFEMVRSGQFDTFNVFGEIKKLGNENLPIFFAAISQETVQTLNPQGMNTAEYISELRHFSLLAIKSIGTDEAYKMIIDIAKLFAVPLIKAECLKIITEDYHNFIAEQELIPSADVFKLFIENMNDTTKIEAMESSINNICMEGLNNWTAPMTKEVILSMTDNTNSQFMTPNNWWENNKIKINWNKEEKYFEIN